MSEANTLTLAETLADTFSITQRCEWLAAIDDQSDVVSTFGERLPLLGTITPLTKQYIGLALKYANQYGFHLLPVSSNNNWGYGTLVKDKVPRPLVLLDLQKLCKITATSKELGLITLEPGVTQQQLRDYFDQNDWPYMVPVTGAGPNCSIVSNALERGYGITPHTDHFQACTALKAFIPHPDLCQHEMSSAVSELDKSDTDFIDKTFKWGLGPYLDGLFTQSNLAVVSEMTFRIAKVPEKFSSFYIQIFDDARFEQAVTFIQEVLHKYSGSVGSINLMDRRRLLSMTVDNPNLHKTQNTYLSEQQVDQLAKQNKTPEWLIVGSIYGDAEIVHAIKGSIKRQARKLGKLMFSDSLALKLAKWMFNTPLSRIASINKLKQQISKLDEGKDIMLGKPNQVALPLAYWRNRQVRPMSDSVMDPARDQCGLLWYAPLVKMDAKNLRDFVRFTRTTIQSFDLDPFITFTNLRHDCIDSTVPIVFNLSDKNETERANKCLSALVDQGLKKGFVPYRLSASEQQRLYSSSVYWSCIEKIKHTLDPNGVVSPGRYCAATQTR